MKKLLVIILLVFFLLFLFKERAARIETDATPENDTVYTLLHDGLTRTYKVHTPPGYAREKLPLVIYFHGGGGDMRAAYMDGIDAMADKHGFILAIPEGTGEIKLGHMRASWNGGAWETGTCCGTTDDVGFVEKMLQEIKSTYTIDEKRIFATGISNGGLMTNRLACELSEQIAAIATVAPAAIPSDCNPANPVSIMDIHGTDDPANPPDGSEPRSIFEEGASPFGMAYKRMTPYQVIGAWKQINKCGDSQKNAYAYKGAQCTTYDKCAIGSEVELCLVRGMGHTYPSGSQYLPGTLVGNVSYDISFDQIWDFFKKHSK